MIESRGIATTVVGLVRVNLEKTKPPRSLFVPFPLGRPFGEAEDATFQRRVLMAALDLLGREDGPVLLEDFPDDAPSMIDTDGWTPAIELPARPAEMPADAADWVTAMAAELAVVKPHWLAAQERFGRTTVGNARLAMSEWVPFAAQFLTGDLPDSPVDGLSPAVVARYIADDIKACYFEAVQAEGPQPAPLQVARWFWGQTLAAEFLRTLRSAAMESEHNGFKTAGSRFIVPMPYVNAL
jgi:hypothetical protein